MTSWYDLCTENYRKNLAKNFEKYSVRNSLLKKYFRKFGKIRGNFSENSPEGTFAYDVIVIQFLIIRTRYVGVPKLLVGVTGGVQLNKCGFGISRYLYEVSPSITGVIDRYYGIGSWDFETSDLHLSEKYSSRRPSVSFLFEEYFLRISIKILCK